MQQENLTQLEPHRPQFRFMAFVIFVAMCLTLLHCHCKGEKEKPKSVLTEAQKVESFINNSEIPDHE